MKFLTKYRKWIVLAAGLFALVGLSAGAYRYYRPDPQLAKIRELGEQMRTAGREMPNEQRRELFRQMRQQTRSLTPDQQEQLRKEREDRRREEMKKFFQMSKEDQTAYLDRIIKQGEERRQQWQQNQQANQQGNQQADNQRRQQQQQAGQGPPPRGQGNRTGSDEDRDRRRREMLDRSTPEDRAMAAEFRKMMNERRKELGLPPMQGGRGGGGGPGWGGGFGGGGRRV